MKEIRSIKQERNVYDYYCDCCGKHILSSIEWDDGWHEEPIQVKIKVFIDNYGWLVLKLGQLCGQCNKEKKAKIIDKLLELGFKKERA